MQASHHINRTRLYLKYAAADTAVGDYDRAAKALARATSHAATAVGVHWDFLCGLRGSRRRLQSALNELAYFRYISRSLAGVLRESYALPDRIQAARAASPTPDAPAVHRELIRLLRRTRMRARRVLKAILKAMADHPNPPTWNDIMADIMADIDDDPAPAPAVNLLGGPPAPPPAPSTSALRPEPPHRKPAANPL